MPGLPWTLPCKLRGGLPPRPDLLFSVAFVALRGSGARFYLTLVEKKTELDKGSSACASRKHRTPNTEQKAYTCDAEEQQKHARSCFRCNRRGRVTRSEPSACNTSETESMSQETQATATEAFDLDLDEFMRLVNEGAPRARALSTRSARHPASERACLMRLSPGLTCSAHKAVVFIRCSYALGSVHPFEY